MIWFTVILISLENLVFKTSSFSHFKVENVFNPLITHWPDEENIRQKMEEYAKEKFAHNYHHFFNFSENATTNKLVADQNKSLTRFKRDGGFISGPVTVAVVSGIIGMTAKTVSDLTSYHPVSSDGGCKWFGTAPLCNYHCPTDYDFIRSDNGRCYNFWLSPSCLPDDSFGEPCSTIFGSYFKKRFCCKSDPHECTWAGRWMGASNAHNAYCRYDNSVGLCGELSCSINHYDWKAKERTEIGGEKCDQLTMFNYTGHATCGFIGWFDGDGKMVNSWYKTGG